MGAVIPLRAPVLLVAAALLAGCGSSGNNVAASASGAGGSMAASSSTSSSGSGGSGGAVDLSTYLTAPPSCAYVCPNAGCAEQTTPYACPAAGAWAAIPHEAACPSWDGTYPAPVAGKCTASAPTGAALLQTGVVPAMPTVHVLPDGRPIQPAGSEWQFNETAQAGGETHSLAAVPGTTFVVTIDTGTDDHAVRVVDASLVGKGDPVVGFVPFTAPSYLDDGVAVLASGRVYVATGFGVIQALDVDLTTGALTRNDAASLPLPMSTAVSGAPLYASGVAASPDGTRLVVGSVFDTLILVFDIDPTSPTYQMLLGQVDIGQKEILRRLVRPPRPQRRLRLHRRLGRLRGGRARRHRPHAAQGVALVQDRQEPGGRRLPRRALDGRSPTTSARPSRSSTAPAARSRRCRSTSSPGSRASTSPAWPRTRRASRLYATLAGVDALAAYDRRLTQTPPTLTPAGRLPTSWWPSGARRPPRRLAHGGEPARPPHRALPGRWPSAAAATTTDEGQRAADPRAHAGRSHRRRGAGRGHGRRGRAGRLPDGRLPPGRERLPRARHQHRGAVAGHQAHLLHRPREQDVRLALRRPARRRRRPEHHDARDGRRDGPGVDQRSALWRAPSRWPTTITRSPCSRRRATTGPRTAAPPTTASAPGATTCAPVPLCGISDDGRPEEGSLFEWLQANDVVYDILGEIVGNPQTVPAHAPDRHPLPGRPGAEHPLQRPAEGLLHGGPRSASPATSAPSST